MTRIYITKWVLARGILVTDAEIVRGPTPSCQIDRAWINLPGMRYARPLFLDREFFLTLKEAKEDARERFSTALKLAERQVVYLKKAASRMEKLQVHKPGAIVGHCHAFKDAGVQSGGGWIVDPARLARERTKSFG